MMHLYVYKKINAALSLHTSQIISLITWIGLMVFAPFIIRYSEMLGWEFVAQLMSYAGYIWMGALFLFIMVSLFIDVIRLIMYLASKLLQQDFSAIMPAAKSIFFATNIIVLSICGYGYYEAKNIRIEKITINTSRMSHTVNRLRLVQISDVHLGLIVREDRLRKIINVVEELKPDILVSTGDLVDGQINELDGLSDLFNEINPVYGKFAVTGNHEFYAGLDQAIAFTEKAGFTLLRGKAVNINGILNIAGVDDRTAQRYGRYAESDEPALLRGLNQDVFTLLLKHRPRVNEGSAGLFDLQLSGHTHKGQIFPFSLVTGIYFPMDSGFINLQAGSSLYVSRGTGTWGPPIRFLSPPEITVIDIVPKT
jgi:predicted MPP superfamily phosphohydrolase